MKFFVGLRASIREYFLRDIKEAIAKDYGGLKADIEAYGTALGAVKAATSKNPNGRNWCVLAYRLGERDVVKLYDFGTRNTVAIRDMLDRFERAGIQTQKNGR